MHPTRLALALLLCAVAALPARPARAAAPADSLDVLSGPPSNRFT